MKKRVVERKGQDQRQGTPVGGCYYNMGKRYYYNMAESCQDEEKGTDLKDG